MIFWMNCLNLKKSRALELGFVPEIHCSPREFSAVLTQDLLCFLEVRGMIAIYAIDSRDSLCPVPPTSAR